MNGEKIRSSKKTNLLMIVSINLSLLLPRNSKRQQGDNIKRNERKRDWRERKNAKNLFVFPLVFWYFCFSFRLVIRQVFQINFEWAIFNRQILFFCHWHYLYWHRINKVNTVKSRQTVAKMTTTNINVQKSEWTREEKKCKYMNEVKSQHAMVTQFVIFYP